MREVVANFRILRGSHRAACLCWLASHSLALVSAFIPRWQLAGERVRCRFRARFTVALIAGKSFHPRRSDYLGIGVVPCRALFRFRSREAEGGTLTRSLLGFSLCAAGALFSRVTFGAPFMLIAPLLALRIKGENRITNLTVLLFPLSADVVFLSLAKLRKIRQPNWNKLRLLC